MKKIEITLDDESGAYSVVETFDNYQQGFKTYNIDEALQYLGDRMEKLTYED